MKPWLIRPDASVPSGGNTYNRRLCDHLPMREVIATADSVGQALAAVPDGDVVLVDGLVACGVPEAVAPHAGRLRLAVLVHMPRADEARGETAAEVDARERETLQAVPAVVATSRTAAARLVDQHDLDPARVHAVAPGVDPAKLAPGTPGGGRLVCVAAVTPQKAQDTLVEALARVADLEWSCRCIGPLRDPAFAEVMRAAIERHRLGHRLRLMGPQHGTELDASYQASDLLVLSSRGETYGMVVTEALARGIPVVARPLGGLPEALGVAADGTVPGLLDDDLAGSLRRWLTDADLRERLRASARLRRDGLDTWGQAAGRMAEVLLWLEEQPC